MSETLDTQTVDHPPRIYGTLQALKDKGLPRLDWRTIFKVEGTDITDADNKAMDEYFSQFLAPGPCPKCGSQLTGDILKQFIGLATFTWGLAHGEGFCSKCKYPARAYHRNVGPIEFLNMVLPYHPDELEQPKPAAAAVQEEDK